MVASVSAVRTRFSRTVLASLLVWAALGLLFAAQLVAAGGFTWGEAVALAARDGLPWALITPLLFTGVGFWPLERGSWAVRVPVYVAGGVVVALLAEAAGRSLLPDPAERFREQRRRWVAEGWAGPGGPEGGRPFPEGGRPFPEGGRPFRGGPPPGMRPGDVPPRDGSGARPRGLAGLLGTGRLRWNLAVYGVVVSIAHAALFQRRSQERGRRSLELAAGLSEARMRALRMQLQPHFLFNTLNAISSLVHRDPDRADEMIASLSDFLRLTLEGGDRAEVPLARELEFADRYLAIEQVRFGDRLRVERDVDPGALGVAVPTLLLQPLVENAVRHGLEPRPGPGRLRLAARLDGGRLRIEVEDDGVGVPPGGPVREGVGLANTRARLAELHGDAASLVVEPGGSGGTRVRVELPVAAGAGGGRTAP